MTRDEIMALANQTAGQHWMDEAHIQRFASLIAAAEREACANEADYWIGFDKTASQACVEIAAAIRARSKQ